MKCRHCCAEASIPFVDLGSAPPSNAYLQPARLNGPEIWLPLRVVACPSCWLVQTEDMAAADTLFDDEYAYFSSYSASWLRHAERYVDVMTDRFGLGVDSHVVEVAANDGYLLQYVAARGIPCTAVEPTASTAAAARAKGLDVVQAFFGRTLARTMAADGLSADLMIANNVLAHVPDIVDFAAGFSLLLKHDAVATFEFPHLLRLVAETQYDTIYHEHYSYLSLTAVRAVFATAGLEVFDVEELPTHGGSLRVFAQRADSSARAATPAVEALLARENAAGVATATFYEGFQPRVDAARHALLRLLLAARRRGLSVVGYGAAAKGNTALNYAGVRPDLLPCVVDRNPQKVGRFLPGSRIPILPEAALRERKPAIVLVLPWNLHEEVRAQLAYVADWGGVVLSAAPAGLAALADAIEAGQPPT